MSTKKFFGNQKNNNQSSGEAKEVKLQDAVVTEKKETESPAQKEKRTLTVFGSETEFDGILEFSDDLIITGKFNGTIKATGNLEISKNAVCTIDTIDAKSIIVSGDVTGNMNATERVEICSGANVTGDIKTARIRIASNVEFEGQVTMIDTEPSENIFAVSSAEYKQALVGRSDIIE